MKINWYKWFGGLKGIIWIAFAQVIMLAFSFYPFLKWDWQIRDTPLEHILKPGYAAQSTFLLMVLYYILNVCLVIGYFRNNKSQVNLLNNQISEMYEELQSLRTENDKLKDKLDKNA